MGDDKAIRDNVPIESLADSSNKIEDQKKNSISRFHVNVILAGRFENSNI